VTGGSGHAEEPRADGEELVALWAQLPVRDAQAAQGLVRAQPAVRAAQEGRQALRGHLATVRGILSESVSKLDLEAGLRGAELEGRVGAYRVMFEVTKIISKLSRPLVKLQVGSCEAVRGRQDGLNDFLRVVRPH